MNAWMTGAALTIGKSISAALVLFFLARLMGKKQISQLSFFDYAVGISIGSVAAAVSVDRSIPLLDGLLSLIVWGVLPLAVSLLSQRGLRVRETLDGRPYILMFNGKIVEENLRRSRFTVNDLLEELRLKDVFDPGQVCMAILETDGRLSVLAPPGDAEPDFFLNLIIDGRVLEGNLRRLGKTGAWLQDALRERQIASAADVLLAVCSGSGVLRVDQKNSDPPDLPTFL